VGDALDREADQIKLEGVRMDGSKHDVTLRAEIVGRASLYLARDIATRSLPTPIRPARTPSACATGRRVNGSAHNGYAPDKDMMVATDAHFDNAVSQSRRHHRGNRLAAQ
jgi:hypothetical protein